MENFSVEFYETASGECPAKIFLDKVRVLSYDFTVVLIKVNNVSGSKSSAYRDEPTPETLRI